MACDVTKRKLECYDCLVHYYVDGHRETHSNDGIIFFFSTFQQSRNKHKTNAKEETKQTEGAVNNGKSRDTG